MDEVLVDTDIASEIFSGVDRSVLDRAAEYVAEHGAPAIAAPTAMELTRGLHRLRPNNRRRRYLAWIPRLRIIPFDASTADLAGRLQAELERAGTPIGIIDPMIAATALQHGLALVTGNTAHYQRIQALGYDLKLDNWRL